MSSLGRYELLQKLGTGGMAEVFLARFTGPGGFEKRVVIKRIRPDLVDEPGLSEMFLTEARLAALVNHPHVVQLFDFGQVDGQYFIAMEHVEGVNLRTVVEEANARGQPLPWPECIRLVILAAEGLSAAHNLVDTQTQQPIRIVHRDVSPENLLLSGSGTLKVSDFGIAKALVRGPKHQTGRVRGKLAYMSPEQLAREPVDARSDLYSLGVVLFELLTGRLPFDASDERAALQSLLSSKPHPKLSSVRGDCPSQLDKVLSRALAKRPEARFNSCAELQLALERVLADEHGTVPASALAALVHKKTNTTEAVEPTPAALTRTSTQASGRGRRLRGRMAAVVATAMMAVLGGLWLSLRTRAAPAPAPSVVVAVPAPEFSPPQFSLPRVEPERREAVSGGPRRRKLAMPEPAIKRPVSQPAASSPPAPEVGAADETVTEAKGMLAVRVRPYATVYLDGSLLGDTPLAVIPATVGIHQLRLVNPSLGADVTVDVEIRSGETKDFRYKFAR